MVPLLFGKLNNSSRKMQQISKRYLLYTVFRWIQIIKCMPLIFEFTISNCDFWDNSLYKSDIMQYPIKLTYNKYILCNRVRVMVFNATFNNISVISWRSVLLVEEIGVPGKSQWPAAIHWQTLLHNVTSSTPRHEQDSNSQR